MVENIDMSGIIIAGGGRIGLSLAEQLSINGECVTVIDNNCELRDSNVSGYTGTILEGDASNIDVLRLSGISSARAVISATGNDNVNLMIAQIARDIYEVPIVIAIVNDPKIIAAKDGFNFVILCPAIVMAKEIIENISVKEG